MNCPACGGTAALIHPDVPDFEYGLPVEVDFHRCATCALLFQSPSPTKEQLRSWYTADYSHHSTAKSGVAGLLGKLKDIQTSLLVRKCAPFLGGHDAKILEIGCGTGRFLFGLEKRGYRRLTGVDQAGSLTTEKDTAIRFIAGAIEDGLALDPPYDAIVMHSVIEHFADPAQALRICAGLLGRGGRLLVRTPNANALSRRVFGRHWAGLHAPRHSWVFNRGSLESAAGAAGFGNARWIRVADASAWAISLQNLLVGLRVSRIPSGGVAWHSLLTLPFWQPLASLEALFGASSQMFGVFWKERAA